MRTGLQPRGSASGRRTGWADCRPARGHAGHRSPEPAAIYVPPAFPAPMCDMAEEEFAEYLLWLEAAAVAERARRPRPSPVREVDRLPLAEPTPAAT